ncbi:MAG: cytochrome P450 [Halioglobus sp.]|jgi:cytochrome P450
MTTKEVDQVDLSSNAHIECPYKVYSRMHEGNGLAVDPELGVAVGGYDDVVALAKNTVLYSSSIEEDDRGPRHMGVNSGPVQDDVEEILSNAHPIVNALFTADPPAHTRHRKLISKALGPRKVRELEPQLRAVANELIDAFIDAGQVDFLPAFAVPFPVTVISDILGVDRKDIWKFKHWGDLMISGNIDVLSHQRRREVAQAVVDLHQYFVPRIEERRLAPRDDLLSEMVNARVDGEAPLTTEELLPIIDQILLAGHETTTNLVCNGLVNLLRNPDLVAQLRAQPELIEPMVEEVLRWDPPIQCTFRRATADSRLHGVAIPKGEMVLPMWGAANRDPAEFPAPDIFDITRKNVRKHMGFGYGPHFCAGAELARLEARIAFELLLERLGDLELDEAASDLTHLPSFASHGYQRVVLRFNKKR